MGLHTRTAVTRLPLLQLGFLIVILPLTDWWLLTEIDTVASLSG